MNLEEKKKKEEEIIEEEFDLDEFTEEVVKKNKPLSDGVLAGLAATTITYAVNTGRNEYFESVKKDTYAYEFSALLDSKTCNRCLSLDGRVIEANDSAYQEQMPSLHIFCRCLWIRIDKSEDDLPKITGIPENIPTEFNEIPKYPTLRKDQKEARIEVEKRIKRLEKKVKKYETSETYPNRVKSLSKTISGLKRAL